MCDFKLAISQLTPKGGIRNLWSLWTSRQIKRVVVSSLPVHGSLCATTMVWWHLKLSIATKDYRDRFIGRNLDLAPSSKSIHNKWIQFFISLIPDALSSRVRVRTHYRAHQLSVWLRLIPKLHAAGSSNIFPQVEHDRHCIHGDQAFIPGRDTECPRNIRFWHCALSTK